MVIYVAVGGELPGTFLHTRAHTQKCWEGGGTVYCIQHAQQPKVHIQRYFPIVQRCISLPNSSHQIKCDVMFGLSSCPLFILDPFRVNN